MDTDTRKKPETLARENRELRARLEESEKVLRAIRIGEGDAVLSSSPKGEQVFTLKSADHAFQMMVEQMSESAVTMDLDGLVLFANANLSVLLGLPAERVRGNSFQDFVSPGGQTLFARLLKRAAKGKATGEVLLTTACGMEVPVFLSLSPLLLDEKTIVSALITDLSKQKKTEEMLSSGSLSTAILEQAAEAIVVCDPSGVVIRASAVTKRLCGKDPLGAKFEDVLPLELIALSPREAQCPPDKKEAFLARFRLAGVTGGSIAQVEACLRREDGRVLNLLLSSTPLYAENGESLGWVVSLTDITERKRTEDELRLARDAAEKARKTAEQATKAKSEFLANMSHEIRTPMNGILGMTELALLQDIPEKAKEYLRMVKQSGHTLLEIINDILDLSKIEAGKVELERIAFDLRASLETALKPLEVTAWKKGIEFQRVIGPEAPDVVEGDSGRLCQVLTNIVGNAVKFSKQGRIRVSVNMAGDSPPGKAQLLFLVKDDGIGIPQEKLSHIFESFNQVGGSAHAQYGGTGLGLSISKELVAMMGGRIWVNSKLGKGSTFYFTVILGLADQPASGLDPHIPQCQTAAMKVLLAEDNLVNRILAVELLEHRGHEVDTAENGREAVEKLRHDRFDLVLMDVQMPEMDGLEAVAAIRRGEAGEDKAGTKVVALTAHALQGDRERFLASGMDDYLSKPIDMDELDRVLKRFEEQKEAG